MSAGDSEWPDMPCEDCEQGLSTCCIPPVDLGSGEQQPCGGCQGLGSHRRWCEAWVGRSASLMGRWSQQAESLGDTVGPNEMGAANHLWAAASLLRVEAHRRAVEHHLAQGRH